MQYIREKFYPSSVKRKILIGFSLACLAILLALGITHFSFRAMLTTVDELSAPNEKLTVLNNVFEEITTLDQLQRAEAIRNPKKPNKAFLNQSETVNTLIDTLLMMPWDSAQQARILVMREILHQRNALFFSYLKLKSRLSENLQLTGRLDTLSVILDQSQTDTSVVTTQRKTTTTYWTDSVTPAQSREEKTRLGRLFAKKKSAPQPTESHMKVEEELSVKIDTVSVARKSKALEEVERIMTELESTQQRQSKQLQRRELELIRANSEFISELLHILHEVETEEMAQMRANNQHAGALFYQSIFRIGALLLVFFLVAALLVYLIWIDISKSNYYKEQLERSRDEAEELGQIKERFLANMSHEIRTPLQSIIGFAEQLKQLDGREKEAAAAIHSSSEHLLHIVNEVLDYSRISSGNFSLTPEPFVLRDLIHEVESAIRVQAEKKGLTFLLDYEQASDYTLYGDPFRLRQILYNLLGNAVKFTHKGFVRLTVKTIEHDRAVRCTFDVADTGIGIRAEDVPKIFNQFEQASTLVPQQHGGGAGLGLTIVKSLVEVQHGSLDVNSEPGRGATFHVSLTFPRAEHALRAGKNAPHTGTSRAFTGSVLLVDDDPMILRLCGLILSKHTVRHTLFIDPEKLLSEEPDARVTHILMDIRMPRMNGVELCHALRKKYDASSTRFIALTAHVFPQDRQKLIDEGFDSVLTKPFYEQELLEILGITTAPAPVEPAAATLDFAAVRRITFGDEALFQSVIQQFMEETTDDTGRLREYIRTKDRDGAREIVHRLAGRLGQLGMHSLSTDLRAVEKRMHDGDESHDIWETIDALKEGVETLLKNIRITSA